MIVNNLNQYKEAMHGLIFEKPTMTPEKKVQKENAICQLAKDLFLINGDKDFQMKIQSDIEALISLKPGRKLIKGLSKVGKKIQISPGSENLFKRKSLEVLINSQDHSRYTTFSGLSVPNSSLNSLAHELIHAYHLLARPEESELVSKEVENFEKLSKRGFNPIDLKKSAPKYSVGVIPSMHNLEEQNTIVGFWHSDTSKKCIQNKLDIINENAFLFSLGLPPRINHEGGDGQALDLEAYKIYPLEMHLESYYSWLEYSTTIASYVQAYRHNPSEIPAIPEELQSNINFMYSLFVEEPGLINFFPTYRSNREFLLQVYKLNINAIRYFESELTPANIEHLLKGHPEFIQYFPNMRNNYEFMLSIIRQVPDVINYLESENLKDRDFVLNCLKLFDELSDSDWIYEDYKSVLCMKVHKSLWDDPEIQKHDWIFSWQIQKDRVERRLDEMTKQLETVS